WYGGPGPCGGAVVDLVDFSADDTDVPGSPAKYLRYTWKKRPTGGESQHDGAPRSTFLEHQVVTGVEDVSALAGRNVVVSFYANVGSGSVKVVPILWQSFGYGVRGGKGEAYELYEAAGTPGVVMVAYGNPSESAICTATT